MALRLPGEFRLSGHKAGGLGRIAPGTVRGHERAAVSAGPLAVPAGSGAASGAGHVQNRGGCGGAGLAVSAAASSSKLHDHAVVG
ncbi:MAG: hypothetical protein KKA73_03355, partial [Chloroflexi bacterium]|nr:hypothetical protein [Chloroflexota bacterium]MBU1746701.1 hypothetical protein [Chloroflexota bacterium]